MAALNHATPAQHTWHRNTSAAPASRLLVKRRCCHHRDQEPPLFRHVPVRSISCSDFLVPKQTLGYIRGPFYSSPSGTIACSSFIRARYHSGLWDAGNVWHPFRNEFLRHKTFLRGGATLEPDGNSVYQTRGPDKQQRGPLEAAAACSRVAVPLISGERTVAPGMVFLSAAFKGARPAAGESVSPNRSLIEDAVLKRNEYLRQVTVRLATDGPSAPKSNSRCSTGGKNDLLCRVGSFYKVFQRMELFFFFFFIAAIT